MENWDIRLEGRRWEAEALNRYELTPERTEMIEGKLFTSDEERLAMLGLLLENVGARAAVRLGNPDVWRTAVAGLPADTPSPRSANSANIASDAKRALEATLLSNLHARRESLQNLLTACSNHWGFEDPIYRFYHQSFKVFSLQSQTDAIVQELGRLLPGQALNPWFLDIVREGTGKTFQSSDNSRWSEATRPIVEAFFHARFFLEMALKYASVDSPPSPLPSGYAALLCLYQLR